MELAINKEPTSFDMSRLLSPQYFDPYSIFIPDINKLASAKGFEEITYLPFNLQTDYLALAQAGVIEALEVVPDQPEMKQSDSTLD